MDDVDEEEKQLPESDEEVFEINDFTNATPWERLTSTDYCQTVEKTF